MRDLETEILEVLEENPCHVYELKYRLESRNIQKSHSDLYKILRSLEKRALVAHTRAASSKGPERKVYGLTGEGSRALEDAVRGGVLLLYRTYIQHLAAQAGEQIALEVEAGARHAALVLSPFAASRKDPWVAAARGCLQGAERLYLVDNGQGADHPGFHRLAGDAAQLPFPDERLDLILAPWLSATDLEAVLDEISRVLDPDGTLVTLLPIARETVEDSLLVEFLVREIGRRHPHFVPRSRLDFIRDLDSFFHVMIIPCREGSLFICRKEEP